MASTNNCLASLARLSLSSTTRPSAVSIPRFLVPSAPVTQARYAVTNSNKQKEKKPKKKKAYKHFRTYDLRDIEQYSMCDAVRYLRAFEVGYPPSSVKYEIALKLKTRKNGPVVRNTIQLPHPVKTDSRVGVICPENSPIAAEARQLGAVAVGEETLFQSIRDGHIPFNKLLCHVDSEDALKKANLGRMLGPKGLMPSLKTKTITRNVKAAIKELVGADQYRERNGVLRMAVGQVGFTTKMLADNVKFFVAQIKSDINTLEDQHGNLEKAVDEIVLSSTNGPGFSLNGGFNPTDDKIKPEHLEGAM